MVYDTGMSAGWSDWSDFVIHLLLSGRLARLVHRAVEHFLEAYKTS